MELEPGWLDRDVRRAALLVARDALAEAEREVRNLNDALSDACTKVKAVKAEIRRLERAPR